MPSMRGPLLGRKLLQPAVPSTTVVAPARSRLRRERGRIMSEADISYPYGGDARHLPEPTPPANHHAAIRTTARRWHAATGIIP